MQHQALYNKWRPQTFDEVCGQEHITDILKYETEKGLFCHAYLFCGSRGTGKTTCAKLLARAVNCEHPRGGNPCGECEACLAAASGAATDILEMDAASNNKVDDIRNILDEVVYTPTSLRYRVYIIDEVHMLSASAFNALLKTLEEPPSHVIFILATTEMQKLPATIISRCQRFDFRRLPASALTARLHVIADAEGIALDDDAALMLARLAQGGMRDAISLFELCAGGGRDVTADTVSTTAGVTGRGELSRTVRAVAARDVGQIFDIVAAIDSSAKDIAVFWQELIGYYRDMLVMKTASGTAALKYLDLTDAEAEMLRADASEFTRELLSYHSRLLDEAYTSMQRPGASRRTVAELTLVRICDERLGTSPDALLARIAALETRIAQGVVQSAQPAEKAAGSPVAVPSAAGKTGDSAKTDNPAAPYSIPAENHAPAAGGKRVLRPLRCWVEILDSFRATNAGVAALLSTEKAYTDDAGRVIICYSKDVTHMMISAPEKLSALCGAVSTVMDKPVDANMIVFEKTENGGEPDNAQILRDELDALADGDNPDFNSKGDNK